MEYQNDPNVTNIDDQFFFGPYMMINPVTTLAERSRDIYFPSGIWYNFWTGAELVGGQKMNVDAPLDIIPIFVKAGAIIPLGPDIQNASERSDPIEIRVYKGANGNFTLYEDNGEDYSYEKGKYSTINLSYNDKKRTLTIGPRTGSYAGMKNHTFFIIWVDQQHRIGLNSQQEHKTKVQYNGSELIIKCHE